MADVQLHEILGAIRGTLGNIVFKKRDGKLYLSRRPDFSKRELSAAQKESVKRFGAAVKHAKKTLADPSTRKLFERAARGNGKTVYSTIISEYLKSAK